MFMSYQKLSVSRVRQYTQTDWWQDLQEIEIHQMSESVVAEFQ